MPSGIRDMNEYSVKSPGCQVQLTSGNIWLILGCDYGIALHIILALERKSHKKLPFFNEKL